MSTSRMVWGLVSSALIALFAVSASTFAQEPGQESLTTIPKVLPPTIFGEDRKSVV